MCRWRSGLCSRGSGLVVDGSVQGHLNALAKSKEVCLGCEPCKARKVGREEPEFIRVVSSWWLEGAAHVSKREAVWVV